MPQDLFPNPWLVNTLLDQGFVDQKRGELAEQPVPYGLPEWLAQHFDAAQLSKGKEAQLEDKLIGPLLLQLGRATVNQQSFIVQGKHAKPDWSCCWNKARPMSWSCWRATRSTSASAWAASSATRSWVPACRSSLPTTPPKFSRTTCSWTTSARVLTNRAA